MVCLDSTVGKIICLLGKKKKMDGLSYVDSCSDFLGSGDINSKSLGKIFLSHFPSKISSSVSD